MKFINMIKEIKYNRIIEKFKSFLRTFNEESFFNDTDYHLGHYGLSKYVSVPLTLYYYDNNYKELRLYPSTLQKMKLYGADFTFDISDNDYCNILCDYFFSKHDIKNVRFYICSTSDDENILFEYDKRNKIQ